MNPSAYLLLFGQPLFYHIFFHDQRHPVMDRRDRRICFSCDNNKTFPSLIYVIASCHPQYRGVLSFESKFLLPAIPFIKSSCRDDAPPLADTLPEGLSFRDTLCSCIDQKSFLVILRESPLHQEHFRLYRSSGNDCCCLRRKDVTIPDQALFSINISDNLPDFFLCVWINIIASTPNYSSSRNVFMLSVFVIFVARGTQADESDMDIALIVKPYTKNIHSKD